MKTRRIGREIAFTLIELLVVMGIIGLLLAAAVPAMNAAARGNGITRGGLALGDDIVLARQEAVSKNLTVEVRLIKLVNDTTPGYRAIQVWTVGETNSTAITKITRLPDNIVIAPSPALSPLLTADSAVGGTANFTALGNCSYGGFRIFPSGGLSSSVMATNNFLTIESAVDTTSIPPVNFYAVRVNPITGRVSVIRP